MSFPLFTKHTVRYVKWSSDADLNLLDLHHQSLKIPPPTYINKTIITSLDRDIADLDDQLTNTIRETNEEIRKIKETSLTTTDEVLIYLAVALSSFNFIMLLVIACCLRRLAHQPSAVIIETTRKQSPPLPPKKKRNRKDHGNVTE